MKDEIFERATRISKSCVGRVENSSTLTWGNVRNGAFVLENIEFLTGTKASLYRKV